jgi:hypothetical protein
VAINPTATDEAGATPVVPAASDSFAAKEGARAFLKAARTDLTPEEAASVAGVRWLQYEADRLEQECGAFRSELRDIRRAHETLSVQFHDQRVVVETLRGSRIASIRNEILANICLAAGSAGLAVVPPYLSVPAVAELAYVAGTVSVVLLLGGIFCRKWR